MGTNGAEPSTSSLFAFWTRNLYALYHGRKTSFTWEKKRKEKKSEEEENTWEKEKIYVDQLKMQQK